jgi:hypothetical protein
MFRVLRLRVELCEYFRARSSGLWLAWAHPAHPDNRLHVALANNPTANGRADGQVTRWSWRLRGIGLTGPIVYRLISSPASPVSLEMNLSIGLRKVSRNIVRIGDVSSSPVVGTT